VIAKDKIYIKRVRGAQASPANMTPTSHRWCHRRTRSFHCPALSHPRPLFLNHFKGQWRRVNLINQDQNESVLLRTISYIGSSCRSHHLSLPSLAFRRLRNQGASSPAQMIRFHRLHNLLVMLSTPGPCHCNSDRAHCISSPLQLVYR